MGFTHPAIHAGHIARPVVHGPIYRSGIALHGEPFTAFNKDDSAEEEEEGDDEEERSARVIEDNSGLTFFRFPNKVEKEAVSEKEEEEEENNIELVNDLSLEETSQDLTINLEDVAEQEFEEVSTSSTSTTATTTRTTTTMTPTASIVEKVSEHLGEEPDISVEEDVLVVKSEGEKETIIAVPVQKIQQLIDALEVLKVFFV